MMHNLKGSDNRGLLWFAKRKWGNELWERQLISCILALTALIVIAVVLYAPCLQFYCCLFHINKSQLGEQCTAIHNVRFLQFLQPIHAWCGRRSFVGRHRQTKNSLEKYILKTTCNSLFCTCSQVVWIDVRFDSSSSQLGQTTVCLITHLPSSCFYGVFGTLTLLMLVQLLSTAGKCLPCKHMILP